MSNAMTIASAQRDAGAVSTRNSKMPGSSFAVTVDRCNVGAKLAQIEGSTCHKCYAASIEKRYPSAHQGWTNNYLRATRLIDANPDQWARAMAFQIERAAEKTGEAYHRWFDGGDIASLAMLKAIVRTCELTPAIKHWLPTREAAIVKAFLKTSDLPPNLVIRISSTMIDDTPIKGHANTSTVHRKGAAHQGKACDARERGNQCGLCRACWTPSVSNVSYPLH
jgi:Gene product 88